MRQPSKKQIYKQIFFVYNIKVLNVSLDKLNAIAKIRGIKGYKSMSEERLLSPLNKSELMKESEKNFDAARIETIKNDFSKLRDKLSKPKIKDIRKDLYRIENKKLQEMMVLIAIILNMKVKEIRTKLYKLNNI